MMNSVLERKHNFVIKKHWLEQIMGDSTVIFKTHAIHLSQQTESMYKYTGAHRDTDGVEYHIILDVNFTGPSNQ